MLGEEARRQYEREGFVVARGIFRASETAQFREHFEKMRLAGELGERPLDGRIQDAADPLKTYPRIIHPHRHDEASRAWLLDSRLNAALTTLLGREPLAVQSMFYYKPAGARGQALHQDQYYLRVQPGSCVAAWLAVDDADEANGCLHVAPGSHTWPVLCTTAADSEASFSQVTVDLPPAQAVVPVQMQAGDVLFFHGNLVHGSYPNTTPDRFRRALIGHYIVGDAQQVAAFYHPVLRMDGSTVELGESGPGGPCGAWVERGGQASLEFVH